MHTTLHVCRGPATKYSFLWSHMHGETTDMRITFMAMQDNSC